MPKTLLRNHKKSRVAYLKGNPAIFQTRGFPSLPFDKIGFIIFKLFSSNLIICEGVASGQGNTVVLTENKRSIHDYLRRNQNSTAPVRLKQTEGAINLRQVRIRSVSK